jgi:arabinose-5-phosphate isomerase
MHSGEELPRVKNDALLSEAILEITQKSLGMTVITDDDHKLCGIFTDGDLRRSLDQIIDIHKTPIHTVMTKKCVTISKDTLAAEALQIMEQYKITALVVTEDERPIGVVHMHDLLRAGIC